MSRDEKMMISRKPRKTKQLQMIPPRPDSRGDDLSPWLRHQPSQLQQLRREKSQLDSPNINDLQRLIAHYNNSKSRCDKRVYSNPDFVRSFYSRSVQTTGSIEENLFPKRTVNRKLEQTRNALFYDRNTIKQIRDLPYIANRSKSSASHNGGGIYYSQNRPMTLPTSSYRQHHPVSKAMRRSNTNETPTLYYQQQYQQPSPYQQQQPSPYQQQQPTPYQQQPHHEELYQTQPINKNKTQQKPFIVEENNDYIPQDLGLD